MSRPLAVVFALSLGLPLLAFIVAALAAGTSPDLITSGLTFVVVTGAVIAMLFEVKRLADS